MVLVADQDDLVFVEGAVEEGKVGVGDGLEV